MLKLLQSERKDLSENSIPFTTAWSTETTPFGEEQEAQETCWVPRVPCPQPERELGIQG